MDSEQLVMPVRAPEVDSLLADIYEPAFNSVARFISKRGGTLEEAEDVFQDAFVILYEQYQAGRHIECPVRYITGIAKHLWFKEIRTRRKRINLSEVTEMPGEETKPLPESKLLSLLERAGERCMNLLEAFYFRNDNLQSLMKTFGFSSEHSASVQKYKCIEKIRAELKTKSLSYEDFFE